MDVKNSSFPFFRRRSLRCKWWLVSVSRINASLTNASGSAPVANPATTQ
jgi:hypothetical protein